MNMAVEEENAKQKEMTEMRRIKECGKYEEERQKKGAQGESL